MDPSRTFLLNIIIIINININININYLVCLKLKYIAQADNINISCFAQNHSSKTIFTYAV